mmetsp:Transcript_54953/g.128512  ORF Transcript_54953/g.128512 Transcript_54953/m.128512 type:complete len:412 (+) Transcript_54953:65-1300(+)
MASGLAGKVRRATESDEFDLAGYDQARCDEFVKAAFTDAFPLAEMPRLSFVVGGGKLVRQKYSDDLPKLFMASLSSAGFQEDNTAACELASGGKYKFQHDTGKNLKFVHVFPRVDTTQGADDDGEDEETAEEPQPSTPQELLLTCSVDKLPHYLADHLETYAQRKKLLDEFKARVVLLESIESKLARLEPLSTSEQAAYDSIGVEEVRDKVKFMQGDLQKMVEEGKLTSAEKTDFLEQLGKKVELLEAEIAKAEAEGKSKKLQTLTAQMEVMLKHSAAVKASSAVGLPPLRHAARLKKLHSKLIELQHMEKTSKGHYTVDELKRLGEKPELEEAIAVLEAGSRGWLEEEEVFQERLRNCYKATAGAKKAAGGAQRPSSGSNGGFTAVAGGAKTSKAKASAASTRNSFSALG